MPTATLVQPYRPTHPTRQQLMLARDFLLPFVSILVVALLPISAVIALIIVGGQAHFAIAYLYQYRGRKMGRLFLLAGALLLALAAWYFVVSGAYMPIFITMAVVFSMHFSMDEVTLHGDVWTPRIATTVAGFVLFFLSIVAKLIMPSLTLLPIVFAVAFAGGVVVRLLGRTPTAPSERYLWYLSMLLMLLAFGVHAVAFAAATLFITLLHYANWLIGYGLRVEHTAIERRYWFENLVLAALSAGGYFLYIFASIGALAFLFAPVYYYAWAIVHVVLSWTIGITNRFGRRAA